MKNLRLFIPLTFFLVLAQFQAFSFDNCATDVIPPKAFCLDYRATLDATGNVTIAADDVDNGSVDNCNLVSRTISNNSFDCSEALPNLKLPFAIHTEGRKFSIAQFDINNSGQNSIYVTPGEAISINMDWNSDIATTYCPTCIQQYYIGLASTAGECLYSGTTDSNCNGSHSFSFTAPSVEGTYFFEFATSMESACSTPSSFPNTGENAIGAIVVTNNRPTTVLTVTDAAGNTASCLANITVIDNHKPMAHCQDATVELDANGEGSITGPDVNNGSNDACGVTTGVDQMTTFDCGDVLPNIGLPFVGHYADREFTITDFNIDGNGNNTYVKPGQKVKVSMGWNSTYQSNYCPGCVQQFYVGLESVVSECLYSGGTSFPVSDSKNFTFFAPTTPGTYYFKFASSLQFSCQPPSSYSNTPENAIGSIVVTEKHPYTVMTVTDANGNTETCRSNITVEDNIAPVAVCQTVAVELNNGVANITTADVDNGSYDNCTIREMSLSKTQFDDTDAVPEIDLPFEKTYAGRDFKINTFDVNNSGSNTLFVSPGSNVSVSLDWNSTYASSFCPGCIQQYYVGLETVVSECLYSGGTSYSIAGNKNFGFTAPTTPGIYYFKFKSELDYYCQPPASYANTSTEAIGAIIVGVPPTTILTVTDISGNTGTCEANVVVTDPNAFTNTTPTNAFQVSGSNQLYGGSVKPQKRTNDIAADFNVYPNPANTQITLNYMPQTTGATIMIYDNLGQVVWSNILAEGSTTRNIDLSDNNFADGFYLITIIDGEETKSRRFLVVKE